MKSITTEKGDVLLIEVPENTEHYAVSNYLKENYTSMSYMSENGSIGHDEFEGLYDTILGEITAKGPQFDCEGLVLSKETESRGIDETPLLDIIYMDYEDPKAFCLFDASNSFVSLLNSQGVYLTNPMGEKPISDISHGNGFGWMEEADKWQTFSARALKEGHKYIAILKSK